MNQSHYRSKIAALLLLIAATNLYADPLINQASSGAFYMGAFGGGGTMSSTDLTQKGTAYFNEVEGGPLAVNATGNANSSSGWLVGAHIGYQFPTEGFGGNASAWHFTPGAELEGYYLGGNTITGSGLNNTTARILVHTFSVSYPSNIGVFLVNAILNIDNTHFGILHPYIGIGAGSAVVSISGANATQTAPAEANINHYNSDPNDTTTAFAVEPKVGLRFSLTKKLSLLTEYTHYTSRCEQWRMQNLKVISNSFA